MSDDLNRESDIMRRYKLLGVFLAALVSFIAASQIVIAENSIKTKSNQFWWPDQLDLSPLRDHDIRSNPLGEEFNYAKAFESLDLDAAKKDIDVLLTTSQDWWPADYGTYAV